MIPMWTLGDRLRKARVTAEISTQQMADALVRNRNTITNYESGFTTPSGRVVVRWAELCGVPVGWLRLGDEWDGTMAQTSAEGEDAAEQLVLVDDDANAVRFDYRWSAFADVIDLASRRAS